jgi:hypothetical protein
LVPTQSDRTDAGACEALQYRVRQHRSCRINPVQPRRLLRRFDSRTILFSHCSIYSRADGVTPDAWRAGDHRAEMDPFLDCTPRGGQA